MSTTYATVNIAALTNNHDGSTATATLDGAPTGGSGALGFYCSRIPEAPDADWQFLGPGTPTVNPSVFTLPLPTRGPWYVRAHDNRGYSKASAPVYIAITDTVELDEAGSFLRDTLTNHKPMLDLALQSVWPSEDPTTASTPVALGSLRTLQPSQVKQITLGENSIVDGEYPAVVIHNWSWNEEFAGTSGLKLVKMAFTISVLFVHLDRRANALPAMAAVARRLQDVLNIPNYQSVQLPGGIPLSNCQSSTSSGAEDFVEGLGWAAQASIPWTAETTVIRN